MAKARSLAQHFIIHPSAWNWNSPKFVNLRCSFLLVAHYQNRAVRMADHRVRNAAHQRSPHSTEPPTAHHDKARPYLLGNPHDLLGPMAFGYPQVLLGDLAPVPLYLLDLLIEDLLCLLAQLLDYLRDPDVVGGVAGSDGHDVKLGVGAGSHVHGGCAGQLGVFGAVGGQQDLGGGDAHRATLLSGQRPIEVSVPIVSRTLSSARERRLYNAVPQGLQRLMYPSVWKRRSANFGCRGFSEAR